VKVGRDLRRFGNYMRYSHLFTTTRKEISKEEESINAQLLIRGGFVDKLAGGIYSLLPLGWRVFRRIEAIIREEMESIGGQELLLPVLHPKTNWEKTGRWEDLDVLFRFTSHYTKTEYALGPTHEEVIAPLMGRQNLSYKDFPFAVFQIQNKFRDEKRVKSGLLRGREFFMKDLYSFHTSDRDLDEYYGRVEKAYFSVFERCGIRDVTYFTLASGGSFSKFSHEFQTLTTAGEDMIHLCGACKLAINADIITEQKNACPECGNKELEEKKAVEVGNIFKLGTKYSEPFGLMFKDEEGKKENVIMGCYGIGLNRLLGTVVEVRHDDKGIVWPEEVAPFGVHLVSLGGSEKVHTEAGKVYGVLKKKGVEVLYDDRAGVSAGEKFADADLIGIPYRGVVSEKTEGKIEVRKRGEEDMKMMGVGELIRLVSG
jgi:prolyl-tRNA synthetase